MTGELKKPSELEGFIDKLTLALKNELEHDRVGTKEEKVLRAVEKLYRLYATELDKYQGHGLLHVADKRNATELVEVLLLMGFDNICLGALLSRAQGKNWVSLLIKERREISYLETVTYDPYYQTSQSYFSRIDYFHVLAQQKQYKEYLVSIFNCIVQEEFNKHLPPFHERNLALIISTYIGFDADFQRSISGKIARRNALLKPFIDYCMTHFLDYEAKQVLNNLLSKKRMLSSDIEHELDSLLKNQIHWSKPYTYSLLLSRINTQQDTSNEMANEIKYQVTSVLQDALKTLQAQYRQEYKSYCNLHQQYMALLKDYGKLRNSFQVQDYCMYTGFLSVALILLIQIIAILALPFLSLAGIASYFAGFFCTMSLCVSHGLIGAIAPLYTEGVFFYDTCVNWEDNPKNSALPLEMDYKTIQIASAKLKEQWRLLQHEERLAREQLVPVRAKYSQKLKFLLGFAGISTAALALGIVGICLSNPWIFIGLTTGAAVSTLSSAFGFFKRAQYSLSKPPSTIEESVEPGL